MAYRINTVYIVMRNEYKIAWDQMGRGETKDDRTYINRVFATREAALKYIADCRNEFRKSDEYQKNEWTQDIWLPDTYQFGYIYERYAGTTVEKRISYDLYEEVLE